MRYNPPPNWPAPPPGWTPPPGWQPDPSWPPVPPGWQLWVPDRHGFRGLLVAGVAGAVVTAVTAAVIAIILVVTLEYKPSNEERIRSVVAGMQDAWNRSDFDSFRGYLCTENQQFWTMIGDSSSIATIMRARGRAEFSVRAVKVTGDRARVNVKEKYSNGDEPPEATENFILEAGNWKLCEPTLANEPSAQRRRHG